jgi:hypothetical protein
MPAAGDGAATANSEKPFELEAPSQGGPRRRAPAADRAPRGGEPFGDYRHDATRRNNPPAGLIDLDKPPPKPTRMYAYDPQLQWAGKAENGSFDVDTVSLHIHEDLTEPPGKNIRCVVSVGMFTEGWDAQNVTQILGLRAFSSQLLCEQVVGRALRRMNYEVNPETGLLEPEYADIFGVPFEVIPVQGVKMGAVPVLPPASILVQALASRGDRELEFPRVEGYVMDVRQRVRCDVDAVPELEVLPQIEPTEVVTRTQMGWTPWRAGPGTTVGEAEVLMRDEFYREHRLQRTVFEIARDVTEALAGARVEGAALPDGGQEREQDREKYAAAEKWVRAESPRRLRALGVPRVQGSERRARPAGGAGAGGGVRGSAGGRPKRIPQEPRPRLARHRLREQDLLRGPRHLHDRRRERIDPAGRERLAAAPRVAREVADDVADGISDLRGRAQRAGVVAIREHVAAGAHQVVQPARKPEGQGAHRARQRARPVRLGDHVQVVSQHVVVHHAEIRPLPDGIERAVDDRERTLAAEVPDAVREPQRDVHRLRRANPLARRVRGASARSGRRTSGATALATPGAKVELLLVGHGASVQQAMLARGSDNRHQ